MVKDANQPRVADAVARAVAATGVRVAFGHPGGEVVALIDALERAGVRFVLTHHEATAAFMAGGYGELTGRPGVCVATLGPGATNLVTGIASALLERAPVLAFTGALAAGAPAGTTHQALPLNQLYAAVAKRSVALGADGAGEAVAAAVAEATGGRPGPIHLSLPADVAGLPAPGPGQPAGAGSGPSTEPALAPAPPDLAAARRLVAAARRPAIVAGLGALAGGTPAALTALAHALGAAVAVLPKAKGVLAEDDPLFAGVLEMAGNDLVVELLGGADLVLAVGLDVVEMDKPWRLEAPVIHVDGLPNHDGYYRAELELVGDVPAILQGLAPSRAVAANGWPAATLEKHRAALRDHVCPPSDRLQPWQVVAAVRAALPREAVATSDVGAHKFVVGQLWETLAPRTFFMANGLSSMGYSIPTATAAWLVDPDRPVVAFVGDGGLGMYLGELETLTRLEADLLVVVLADQSLELIRRAQLRKDVATLGTSFANPDFGALGKAFGITAYEVGSLPELEAALEDLVPARGVRLLAARIDGDDYRL